MTHKRVFHKSFISSITGKLVCEQGRHLIVFPAIHKPQYDTLDKNDDRYVYGTIRCHCCGSETSVSRTSFVATGKICPTCNVTIHENRSVLVFNHVSIKDLKVISELIGLSDKQVKQAIDDKYA